MARCPSAANCPSKAQYQAATNCPPKAQYQAATKCPSKAQHPSAKKDFSEAQHQMFVVKWSQQPQVRSVWPELSMLYHIENEAKCSEARGAIRKKMGVKRGYPDLGLDVPRGGYHGLRIEMKNMTGSPSKDQLWWGEKLTEQGYLWKCCHGWEEATAVLVWYLSQTNSGPSPTHQEAENDG